MNEELGQRLGFWMLKAEENSDIWIRFLIYWMIFDSYLTEESGRDRDKDRLRWFLESENDLKNKFREQWKLSGNLLKNLKALSPIWDLRPTKRSTTLVHLEDIEDERQVLGFLYQIRCNTFHGGKDLASERDAQLVRYAGELLREPIKAWLI